MVTITEEILNRNFIFCAVIFLDSKLDFDDHIKGVFDETSMDLFTSSEILPEPFLLQIYKSFVRPYLDYDIICDKVFIGFFFSRNFSPFNIMQNNISLVRVNENFFMNTFFRSTITVSRISMNGVSVIQLALIYLKGDYYNL